MKKRPKAAVKDNIKLNKEIQKEKVKPIKKVLNVPGRNNNF